MLLAVPIFDGGQREGRISESRSLAQQELFKLAVVQNRVTRSARCSDDARIGRGNKSKSPSEV